MHSPYANKIVIEDVPALTKLEIAVAGRGTLSTITMGGFGTLPKRRGAAPMNVELRVRGASALREFKTWFVNVSADDWAGLQSLELLEVHTATMEPTLTEGQWAQLKHLELADCPVSQETRDKVQRLGNLKFWKLP